MKFIFSDDRLRHSALFWKMLKNSYEGVACQFSEMLNLDANKMRIAHIWGIVVISGTVSDYLLRINVLLTYFSL